MLTLQVEPQPSLAHGLLRATAGAACRKILMVLHP